MKNNEKYTLIGVINSLNDCPDFVHPVFEREGKYYIQKGENGTISSFVEIKKEFYYRITSILKINITTSATLKTTYSVGDDGIICFRINKKTYFLSDIYNFVNFIKNYNTEDDILREEIDCFLDGVKRKENKKKRIKQII